MSMNDFPRDPGAVDLIDHLSGIAPGSPLDAIRRRRPQAREHAQQSWRALFTPAEPVPGHVTATERLAVAAFVAGLHRQPDAAAFYARALAARDADLAVTVTAQVAHGVAQGSAGPYGHYPDGPLSRENRDGPLYAPDPAAHAALGARLAAAFAHAHLLVFHPRDARASHLQALLDAGWSETDIVVLSQLVAFLAFQIRAVAGLRALAISPSHAIREQIA